MYTYREMEDLYILSVCRLRTGERTTEERVRFQKIQQVFGRFHATVTSLAFTELAHRLLN